MSPTISKDFGDFHALDDVSLAIPEGGLTALLGPSGSGKSTLLRIIAGLETPDSGQVTIAGRDVTTARPQERGIGFVFQHYAAFAHMSVRDNVAFGLRIRKRGKAEIRDRVDELLALVGLTKWADQRPHQLSGGQRQRMALARALAVEPKVLLLDEPFGALDATVRAELRRWLRRLHDEQGVTTVLVTHDQEEAMEVADHIALMHQGRIEQVGAPREVYDQPANDFVMGFLGPVTKVKDQLVRPHELRLSSGTDPRRRRGDGQTRRAPRLRGPGRARIPGRRGGVRTADAGRDRGARAARGRRGLPEAPARARRSGGGLKALRAAAAQSTLSGLGRGDPGATAHRVTQASGSSASFSIAVGSLPAATSATVTCSTTRRRLARTAIQTLGSASDAPG